MEGDDNLKKIPNKKDAMEAVETLVRYIEKEGGELRYSFLRSRNPISK